jgi:hypothetical protein
MSRTPRSLAYVVVFVLAFLYFFSVGRLREAGLPRPNKQLGHVEPPVGHVHMQAQAMHGKAADWADRFAYTVCWRLQSVCHVHQCALLDILLLLFQKFWRSSMQDERGTTSSLAESKRTLAAHTQAQMMLGEVQQQIGLSTRCMVTAAVARCYKHPNT